MPNATAPERGLRSASSCDVLQLLRRSESDAQMTSTLPTAPASHPSTIVVDALAELTAFYDDAVSVCVLRRPRDPDVVRFAAEGLLDAGADRILRLDVARLDLGELVPTGARSPPGARAFVEDVRLLVGVYADLFAADHVGLRLKVMGAPMCPRFHVDHVGVRMVCTYHGPGTEWLEPGDVDRSRIGHAAGGLPDTESGLILHRAPIQRLDPFDVGLFKGEAWPGNAGRGAVHRSPPGDARRVLVTIEAL